MAITTSPDNIPSPTSGDPYNYVVDMAALADGTQDALTQLGTRTPFAQEVGVTSVSGSGGTTATQTVTFESGLFSVAPFVLVGAGGAASVSFSGMAISITASGFTLRLTRTDGGTYSGSYSVPWNAVQMASGTATGGVGG